MTILIVDTEFLKTNKVGLMCGTVGNTAMSAPEVIAFVENYIEEITLHDWNEPDKQIPIENGIHTLPSLLVKFRADAVLSESEADEFKSVYVQSYGDNFDEDFTAGETEAYNYEHMLLGNAFQFLIEAYDGSLRFEDCETDVAGEYLFETE